MELTQYRFRIGRSLPFEIRHQQVVSLGLGVAAVWGAWRVGNWIAAGDMDSVLYAAIAAVVVSISVTILRNWRLGLHFLLVWLLFEDLIRKFMGNNMLIYFAKDWLAVIIYFSFWFSLQRKREVLYVPRFMSFFSLFFFLGVVQCFNINSPSLLYSLLGFKLYFYYVPLLFVGYNLIRKEEDLRKFLIFNVVVATVIASLGVVQAIAGPGFLNPSTLAPDIKLLSTLYRVSPLTGQILYRPTSVFVSDGRFASYLLLAWLMGLAAAGFILLRRDRGQLPVLAGCGIIAAAALLSGGRGALAQIVLGAVVLSAAFLWGAPWKKKLTHRMTKAIWRGAGAAAAALTLAIILFPSQVGARLAFYNETINPNSSAAEGIERVRDYPMQELIKAFGQHGWQFGNGIGTASLGVQYVSRWLGQNAPPIGVESGFGNIVLELGVLGLFLWFVWSAALLVEGWKVVRKLRQTSCFPVAFAILWFAFLLLLPMTWGTIDLYENYVYNAYFWLLLGILFKLPKLEANRIEAVPVANNAQ